MPANIITQGSGTIVNCPVTSAVKPSTAAGDTPPIGTMLIRLNDRSPVAPITPAGMSGPPVYVTVLLSSAPVRDGVVPPEVAVWTSGLPGADQAAQHAVHEGR